MRLLLLASLLIGLAPLRAGAGVFIYPIRSTRIQADPPRYRTVIGIYDRYDAPLYGIRANAMVQPGPTPATPILEATGPSWTQVTWDPEGWPTWLATPEPAYLWSDSLIIVTGSPVNCVSLTYLVPPVGGAHGTNELCQSADQVTTTRSATWGKLKTLYR